MKKEMIKPTMIVLSLIIVFAIVFVVLNGLAFAGASEDVIQTSDGSEEYVAEESEQGVDDSEGLEGLLEEELTVVEDEAMLQRQEEEGGVTISRTTGVWREDMEFGSAEGFVLRPYYSSIHEFVANTPVHEISVNCEILCDWFGSDSMPMWTSLPEQMDFTMVDHTRGNIAFKSWMHVDDFTLQPHHLTFEQVAALAAVAIYQEYGVSVDGLRGWMHFVGHGDSVYHTQGSWQGFILDPTRTEHNMGDELVHFVIDAVNGEILFLDMTTPDNPWFG